MKKTGKQKTARTLILSALLVAALACTAVFFSVGAAEDDGEVSSADAARSRTSENAYYGFKPNAVYNGSFKSELTDHERLIYEAFEQHFLVEQSNAPLEIDVSRMHLLRSDNSDLYTMCSIASTAFENDHPEIFWYRNNSSGCTYDGDFIKSIELTFRETYTGAYADRDKVRGGIASAVSAVRAARASESRYDTVKAIHDYICDTMTYDYSEFTGEAACAAPLFGGGNKGYRYVCEGYAKSFKVLCNQFAIPAVVMGSTSHAWNDVQMEDGRYYAVDCTWDDSGDTTPPAYTYFLIGSQTPISDNGVKFCQESSHIEYGEWIHMGNACPAVYPELSMEAYVPEGGAIFWGDSAQEGRTVSGLTAFEWKYKGDASAAGTANVYIDDKLYGSFAWDNGFLHIDYDTDKLKNGRHTVRLTGVVLSVWRTFEVQNTHYELLNWFGDNPTLSGTFPLRMKGYTSGTITDCQLRLLVDGTTVFSSHFDADGMLTADIDTRNLSNGFHELTIQFRNSSAYSMFTKKSFRVYNPAGDNDVFGFWGESAADGRMVGDTVAFTVKYNGTVTDQCRFNAYIDDAPVQVHVPNAASVGEFFDDDGFCSFYIDVDGQTNGPHTVKAELVREDGSKATASVNITVTDGYFVFWDWPGDNPIANDWFEIDVKNISGSNCDIKRMIDNKNGYFGAVEKDEVSKGWITVSNMAQGDHLYRVVFQNESGVSVEKAKRFRVGGTTADDSRFVFWGDSAQPGRIVGENAEFTLRYDGDVTNRCRLNVSIDGKSVQAYKPGANGITDFFDENGRCTFYVDVTGQTNGEHTVKTELVTDDGSKLSASTIIVVTDGYFSFENWSGENEAVSDDFEVSFRNISGDPGGKCQIKKSFDDAEAYYSFFDDNNLNISTLDTKHFTNGEHKCKATFKSASGVTVEKIKWFRVFNESKVVPDFSFNTLGASIRLSQPYGIRFGIRLDKNDAFKKAQIVEYGTLIIASGTLGDQELTYYTDKVRRIKAEKILEEDSSHITYTGVLINIPDSFRNTNVKGRGYLIYKDADGEYHIVYSKTVEKSFNGVAQMAYDNYSKLKNPTDEQKVILEKLKVILGIA